MTIKQIKTWHQQNRSILKYLIFNLVLLLLTGWLLLYYTGLHLCLTPSLNETHLILFQKIFPIKKGDIVYIEGHSYKHLGIHPYAKRVIGLPGDPILRNNDTIKIGDLIFPLIHKTTEGYHLTPLTNKVVPEGYLFVAGDHPRSIDSRYEEFGLVSQGNIYGRAIWTW